MLINNIDLEKQKKLKSEYSFLNLEKLVEEFPLDSDFFSKSYYQSNPEYAYNSPPEGPIDEYFECLACQQVGPDYHDERCPRPFTSSLYLTEKGTQKYPEYEEGTSYSLVVVKRGQKKVVSGSKKAGKYTDSVQIKYKDVNDRETIVRISKNGAINIISAGYGNTKIVNQVIDKINQTNSLNKSNYTKVYPSENKFTVHPDITYMYMVFAQFNLYPKDRKGDLFINLSTLSSLILKYKKKYNKDTILMLPDRDNYYYISDYTLNVGDKPSKSNKMTNPTLIFNLIPSDNTNVKINVTFYKRGAVQLRLTNNDSVRSDLDLAILEDCHDFFEELLLRHGDAGILISEIKKVGKESFNTYDGKKPQACADRYGLRPTPYGWFGTCASKDMYVRPEGKKRGDGRYEPCCYKLKGPGTQDSEARYLDILKNGYPDKLAKTFGEDIPDPDVKSAMVIPGTKNIASRRRIGLMDLSKDQLIDCISDSGYISRKTTFDKDYSSLKKEILAKYASLTGTRSFVVQNPETLTPANASLFTSNNYIVTPINDEALNVLLFFDTEGTSYFINTNNDISETSLPPIEELSSTLIEGYMYPYEEEFIFYPIDILFLKGNDITEYPFINQSDQKKSRYNALRYSIDLIQRFPSQLDIQIENRFDLNVISGASNFLTNTSMFGDISGLLFIPYNLNYMPRKKNKNLLLWTNTNLKSTRHISLNVEKVSNNKWSVSLDSKSIPIDLLTQEAGVIEIPVSFGKKLKKNDIVLFEINLFVNGKINTKKPLIAIDILEENINDYNDVINVLQSIQTPISKNTFTDINKNNPPGFTIGDRHYYMSGFNKPMNVIVV
jgi:hypothetical protein